MGAIAQRDPRQDLVERVRAEDFRNEIRLALPDNVSVDRFTRATVTALLANPKLVEVERGSLLRAIIKCAQDGLMPDGREAALVDFKVKGVPTATYLPMVGGYRKIAGEYGWVLRSVVVYANDEFDYALGLDPHLTHRPARVGTDRGAPVAAYAVALSRDGRREFEVMTADEIEKVRQSSRAKDYGPWQDWTERMWEKTAARRLFKKLPLDPADQRIRSVIDADALAPGEAAHVLYGSPPPPAGSLPVAAAEGEEGQHAGSEGANPPTSDPAGPDPEAEDIPFADDEPGPTTDAAAEAEALTAALYRPRTNKWPEGSTLGSIWEHGPDGQQYVRWCITDSRNPETVEAASAFARFYAPELYHEALAERAAKGES